MRAENENNELNRKLSIINEEVEEIKAAKELDEDENGGSLIHHIKVTLIQFLRNVALTDRQNEDLLTIIFNIMDFTPVEINELKMARSVIKMVKGKVTRAASSSIGPGGNSTNSMSKEEDASGKQQRGFLKKMFGRGNSQNTANNMSGGGNNNGSAAVLPPPNLKPVARR